MRKRLALGTAQFGSSYGIANKDGQVSQVELEAILREAWEAGVDTLDTAIVYGDCEERLGRIGIDQWQVVSKLPTIPENCKDVAGWVESLVAGSLERLRIPWLYGLLLHRPEQLLGSLGEELYAALEKLKAQKLVEKIGVSVYGPAELDTLGLAYHFDLVQAPFNVIDRRIATSGWLGRLHEAGTEIHIRSVFLQGLLLMDAINRPEKFSQWQPLWNLWHRWLTEQNLTPLQACLNFTMLRPEVSLVIIGVDSLQQLQEIVAVSDFGVVNFPDNLESLDLNLINPSVWSNL